MCGRLMKTRIDLHHMSTLTICLSVMAKHGYSVEFNVNTDGLLDSRRKTYFPEEVKIINQYSFESALDKADMYMILTSDGRKGTLVDLYRNRPNALINRFVTRAKNSSATQAESRG